MTVKKAHVLVAGDSQNLKQQLDTCQIQLNELQGLANSEQENIKAVQSKITETQTNLRTLKMQSDELSKHTSQIKTLEQNIRKKEANMKDLDVRHDLEAMKQNALQQAGVYARVNLKNQKEISKHLIAIEGHMIKEQKRIIECGIKAAKFDKIDSDTTNCKHELDEMEAAESRSKLDRDSSKKLCNQYRINLAEAMNLTNVTSEVLDDKINKEIQYLKSQGWNNIQDLEDQLHELKENLKKSSTVDNSVIQDYQKREKAIESKQKRVDVRSAELQSLVDSNAKTKETWKNSMTEYINQTDVSFRKYFEDMGCQGRVEFGPLPIEASTAEFGNLDTQRYDEDDYTKYGVIIWVNFRKDCKLKMLTGSTQSGGEKSVSTMLFLLAMQPISKSPFRLIDEINQGMDNRNERMIFQALVTAAEVSKTQYFLITPKLLRDLPYSRRMCIGERLFSWKFVFKKFLETTTYRIRF